MARFKLMVGEPWNFDGPDGPNRIEVEALGVVAGPDEPYWQEESLLLRVLKPFMFRGECVEHLIAAPRHEGGTVRGISLFGGHVGASRVRPGVTLRPGQQFKSAEVEYIIVGNLERRFFSFLSRFRNA